MRQLVLYNGRYKYKHNYRPVYFQPRNGVPVHERLEIRRKKIQEARMIRFLMAKMERRMSRNQAKKILGKRFGLTPINIGRICSYKIDRNYKVHKIRYVYRY